MIDVRALRQQISVLTHLRLEGNMDEGWYIQNGLEFSFSEFSFLDRHMPSWLSNNNDNENIESPFSFRKRHVLCFWVSKKSLKILFFEYLSPPQAGLSQFQQKKE
jgi:hypothetical protein